MSDDRQRTEANEISPGRDRLIAAMAMAAREAWRAMFDPNRMTLEWHEIESDERASYLIEAAAALKAINAAGFVVVHASALGSVIEEAEASVRDACCVRDGRPHPALARRYERDMHDINELRQEIANAR
jgi:hypothetical protein